MPPGKPLLRRRAPARLDLALAAVVDSAAAGDFPAADLAAEAEELFKIGSVNHWLIDSLQIGSSAHRFIGPSAASNLHY